MRVMVASCRSHASNSETSVQAAVRKFLEARSIKSEWLALPLEGPPRLSDLLAVRLVPVAAVVNTLIILDPLAAVLRHERKLALLMGEPYGPSGDGYADNVVLSSLLECEQIFASKACMSVLPSVARDRSRPLELGDLDQLPGKATRGSVGLRALDKALSL